MFLRCHNSVCFAVCCVCCVWKWVWCHGQWNKDHQSWGLAECMLITTFFCSSGSRPVWYWTIATWACRCFTMFWDGHLLASPYHLSLTITDVFSKSTADMLALHHEHDLKIELEEGASPPLGTTCSLFLSELESLHTFLGKHLTMGFICPSSSTHAALVPFVCKEDGSFCLCIDFWGLNRITKKKWYLLTCMESVSCKVRHYTWMSELPPSSYKWNTPTQKG